MESRDPDFRHIIDALRDISAYRDEGRQPPLEPPGDGGRSGGMESWPQSVERRLSQVETDIRTLLRWGALAAVALAGLIGGLYLYINNGVGKDVVAIQVQQAKDGAKVDEILRRLPPAK